MTYDDGIQDGIKIGIHEGSEGYSCCSDGIRDYWDGHPKWSELPRAYKAGCYAGYREGWVIGYSQAVERELAAYEQLPAPPPVAFAYRLDNRPMPDAETRATARLARPSHMSEEQWQQDLLRSGVVTPANFHMRRPTETKKAPASTAGAAFDWVRP